LGGYLKKTDFGFVYIGLLFLVQIKDLDLEFEYFLQLVQGTAKYLAIVKWDFDLRFEQKYLTIEKLELGCKFSQNLGGFWEAT